MFALLLSHPFSGLELIGIVSFWIFIELIIDCAELCPGICVSCYFLFSTIHILLFFLSESIC